MFIVKGSSVKFVGGRHWRIKSLKKTRMLSRTTITWSALCALLVCLHTHAQQIVLENGSSGSIQTSCLNQPPAEPRNLTVSESSRKSPVRGNSQGCTCFIYAYKQVDIEHNEPCTKLNWPSMDRGGFKLEQTLLPRRLLRPPLSALFSSSKLDIMRFIFHTCHASYSGMTWKA